MNSIQDRPIIVGKKTVQHFVLAIQYRLAQGATEVVLRARGPLIAIAADAANMAMNMGLPVEIGHIRIGQEAGPQGKPVSFIELELLKKKREGQ